MHSMTKDIQKCDPRLSSLKREEEIVTLISQWFDCNWSSQSMTKRRRPSAMTESFSCKKKLKLSDTDSDTDSSCGLSEFGSENDRFDAEAALCRCYFFFQQFKKIL